VLKRKPWGTSLLRAFLRKIIMNVRWWLRKLRMVVQVGKKGIRVDIVRGVGRREVEMILTG
jgi:hypothetical protein